MLPHILHSTTRAAAAVQNQTHTIRNVLHLQSGPSSGSGPSWGNGPGPGGSKFNTGSRFYTGYNSAGRAVTQANIITSQDGNFVQNDDADEPPSRRRVLPTNQKRHRIRSSSVSLTGTGRNERGETMGVLKTVQLHARSRHAFAPVETLASAKERLLAEAVDLQVVDVASRPLLVRRNSTSAPLSPISDASTPPIPPPTLPPKLDQASEEQIIPRFPRPLDEESSIIANSTTTKTAALSPTLKKFSPPDDNTTYLATLAGCTKENWASMAQATIRKMLHNPHTLQARHFNAGLRALLRTRRFGQPLTEMIRLYNDMLDLSVLPDTETYDVMIRALTTRDLEVHHAVTSLEARLKNRPFMGRSESTNKALTQDRLQKLRKEDNFASAMSLFGSVAAIGGLHQLSRGAYSSLIRSCAFHSNTQSAIHVFAKLEHKLGCKELEGNNLEYKKFDYSVFRYMILAFSNTRKIKEAEEIFDAFLSCTPYEGSYAPQFSHYQHSNRLDQVKVWNMMIEAYFRVGMPDKAIELLERMLASTAGDKYKPSDTPIVTPSTFTAVINGFIKNDDISSTLVWFDRLLAQNQVAANPFEGLGGQPMRPDSVSWHTMLDALAMRGKIDDLNRLYHVMRSCEVQDRLHMRVIDQIIFYSANLENLDSLDDEAAIKILTFMLKDISAPSSQVEFQSHFNLLCSLAIGFAKRGHFVTAIELLRTFFVTAFENSSRPGFTTLQQMQQQLELILQQIITTLKDGKGDLDFPSAFVLVQLHIMMSLKVPLNFAPWYLHAYGRARYISDIDHSQFSSYDWNVLIGCALEVESPTSVEAASPSIVPRYAFTGLVSLLEDFSKQGKTFSELDADLGKRTIDRCHAELGDSGCRELFFHLGPSYIEAIDDLNKVKYSALESALSQDFEPIMPVTTPQSSIPDFPSLKLNPVLSEELNSFLRYTGRRDLSEMVESAYAKIENALSNKEAPEPSIIGALIQMCGRCSDLEKVRQLYTIGQAVLHNMPRDPVRQLEGWVQVEDAMIVALAHSGNIDAAHVHRLRILDQGRAPSANSYGVLIHYVKDTTDDTSGAIALFQEAVEKGVRPNTYLFNNIISKLAKARKADYALEIFQQMKASGCEPSFITYSALIGACARVGDVPLAQTLFSEMVRISMSFTVPGFKPRVPPYNTMMQLFTTTKPSRESSLYYYRALLRAGVEPSAYTYKLLMDTYGCLEPMDLPSMEKVFKELLENPKVELTSGHFASLINAYGCVAKDFDKAISVFQSISDYPQAPPLDAIIFEAIINVIVAHRRTDLFPVYVSKMNEAGVHMTAYIANFLIKGYASVGNMEQARSLFESLCDPPSGIAAPHNHVPHGPAVSPDAHVMDGVYREPSTWEVMVRAELGVGNNEGAKALLERIKARQYPEAVYNRISGVMIDHSLPPIEPLSAPISQSTSPIHDASPTG